MADGFVSPSGGRSGRPSPMHAVGNVGISMLTVSWVVKVYEKVVPSKVQGADEEEGEESENL